MMDMERRLSAMTDVQLRKLIEILERIAEALEGALDHDECGCDCDEERGYMS
jgi:hypothetical protein